MRHQPAIHRFVRPALLGLAGAAAALPAAAFDLKTADGEWTFSFDGNVNVDYIYSSCQNPTSQVIYNGAGINGSLTCVGSLSTSSVSNIGNGLLPAAFTFGASTTLNGLDMAAHLGLYPGIATNNGGGPNTQLGCDSSPNTGCTNTALGSTGLDIRQVYMTFGNKAMGTFTLGRNIGLFGADAILNDMTLPGVGAPGSAAGASPSNTTLGGIGFGYIYTDWLAQIDYTTPDFSGLVVTVGAFDPINSLTEPSGSTVEPKSAPGFHAKISYTWPINDSTKLYLSTAYLTQKQNWVSPPILLAPNGVAYSYTGDGIDVFAKLDVQQLEVIGYYYHADGLGTTALFNLGAFGLGQTRSSNGYLGQVTYKFGAVKVGVNYGRSNLDTANGLDAAVNPGLVESNRKVTGGVYYSLNKYLTLLGEVSGVKSYAQAGGDNSATTANVGAYLSW